MKLHLNTVIDGYRIRRHAPGQVVVNDTTYCASVIVAPDRIITDWPPRRIADVSPQHMETVAALDPELVLLGTGNRLFFPARGTTTALLNSGVGVEIMDTGAACRTFNILASEGRRVVAALVLEIDG